MPPHADHAARSARGAKLATGAFVILVLYVVTFGPMLALRHRYIERYDSVPSRAFAALYEPLFFLSDVSRPLHDYTIWWCELGDPDSMFVTFEQAQSLRFGDNTTP